MPWSNAPWTTDADALHASGARHVLLLSRENSARGQIAEGIARALAPRQVRITSAGRTRSRVSPLAARVLAELSVDISDQRSKSIDEIDTKDVDAVVTLSDDAECPPALDGRLRVHWPLPDPSEGAASEEDLLARLRGVRNELRRRFIRVFARDAAVARSRGVTTTTLEPASAADGDAIREILHQSLLPARDVGAPRQRFVVAREEGRILGCAGLEPYGEEGQVRSLAVHWTRRNAGFGTRLHDRLLHEAVLAGVQRLWVITATAEDFFARHRWRRVAVEEVPPPIRESEEFRILLPASAACMTRAVHSP
jgi:N-acetylglutamate synthase-like GNAT family acetyltransferase/protein-tyrosine-phosphatase